MQYTTYNDLLQHALDYLGADPSAVVTRDAKRAIREAYRDLPNCHNWTYFYKHGRIITNGAYDSTVTGASIQYQHTSGTYPRQVTISGGTWPTWATGGSYLRLQSPMAIVENNIAPDDNTSVVNYKIAEQKSATVLTLDDQVNPGQDIPSGTPFQIYQDTYLLPEDYIAQDQALFERNFGGMSYTHPREWLYENRYVFAQGVPQCYTITGDPIYPGRLTLKIFPWPFEVRTIDYIYKRRPRAINHLSVTAGTISLTSGSVVATLAGSTFTPDMVGSVIRVSSNGNVPTDDIIGSNKFAFESYITDYLSSTTVNLADAAPSSVSGKGYEISDPIDIERGAMLNAFYRCVEYHLSVNRTLKDKPSAAAAYKKALAEAKDADSRSFMGRTVSPHGPLRRRLRDYPIDLSQTF
jgi:hypothetical protein